MLVLIPSAIIGIGIRAVRHEPSALPCEGASVPCPGIAYAVICYALTVERYKQIAPAAIIVTVYYCILDRSERVDSIRIRFAVQYIPRLIILPCIRLPGVTVILADKLIQRIVSIPEKCRAVLLYLGYISGRIICIRKGFCSECGRSPVAERHVFVCHTVNAVIRDRTIVGICSLHIGIAN